ncbi:MAG TPA: LytTR family DNA-binding domain-containing protein [Chitinophagaceae bacterium]|nr:LytTR family DNA-binding domain-containing protein [Chitinophagaceae bacterium]
MIKTILIEDERLIAEEFKRILQNISPGTELLGTFSSVKESIDYLSANAAPDLIFSDVQLRDGLSFDIFNKVNVQSPVIFITGYDKFMLNAFEHNGIDYLLKPIDEKDIEKALTKYKALEKHFTGFNTFVNSFRQKTRSRLIVRKGIENIALKTDDIVLIYTEGKLVFVIDKEGKKYIADKKLMELQEELDDSVFFRANRQYIVNIAFVKSYKTYEKVKLQVDLLMPNLNHHIVVSQETAPHFRKWIDEL